MMFRLTPWRRPLKAAFDNDIACLLVDHQMPQMSGLALVAQLRAQGSRATVRQRGRVPPEAGACGLTLSYAPCDAAACLLRALANSLVTSGLKAGMSSGFRLVTRLPSTTTC